MVQFFNPKKRKKKYLWCRNGPIQLKRNVKRKSFTIPYVVGEFMHAEDGQDTCKRFCPKRTESLCQRPKEMMPFFTRNLLRTPPVKGKSILPFSCSKFRIIKKDLRQKKTLIIFLFF